VVQSLGAAWAAITGLNVSVGERAELGVHPPFDYRWAPLLAAIAIAAIGLRIWLRSVPRSFWAVLVTMAVYWLTSGLAADAPLVRTPEDARYVFVAVALVLLLTVDGLRGLRPSNGVRVAVFALVAVSLLGNALHLLDGRAYLQPQATEIKAQLRMLELAGTNADPGYIPGIDTPEVSPGEFAISAGAYLETADRLGSWADSTDEVLQRSDSTRRGADVVLARALGLRLAAGAAAPTSRDCETIAPDAGGLVVTALPAGGASLTSPDGSRDVLLRRFADTFAVGLGRLEPATPSVLRIPADDEAREWVASVRSAGPIELCPL
jgi:hypothetical protein